VKSLRSFRFSILSLLGTALTTSTLFAQAPSEAATPATATPATATPAPATPAPATPAPVQPLPADVPATAVTAAPSVAEPRSVTPPPTEAPREPEATAPAAKPSVLKLGGGATLWYYQPTLHGQKNKLEFYNVHIDLDADFNDNFGFHLQTRFRDTKLRSYYDSTAWIEEGYAFYNRAGHSLKVGKIYSRFGLFWDNSFWGNVQVYDGLKLAPDYGVSAEGSFVLSHAFSLGYALQYFLVDGGTNVSIAARDTISIPNSRRRDELVARLDPTLNFAGDGKARLGLSFQRFDADSLGIPRRHRDVARFGVDAQVNVAGFGIWGEYLRQNGQSVTDYPLTGEASRRIDYYLIGLEYTVWRFTPRYNFSAANYRGTQVKEWLHVPALGFKVNDHLQLNAEYVYWSRSLSGVHSPYNRSFNLELFVTL